MKLAEATKTRSDIMREHYANMTPEQKKARTLKARKTRIENRKIRESLPEEERMKLKENAVQLKEERKNRRIKINLVSGEIKEGAQFIIDVVADKIKQSYQNLIKSGKMDPNILLDLLLEVHDMKSFDLYPQWKKHQIFKQMV